MVKQVAKDLKPLEAELEEAKAARKRDDDAWLTKMQAKHKQLDGSNVLVEDDNTGTFTKGYMIGVLVCKARRRKPVPKRCSW